MAWRMKIGRKSPTPRQSPPTPGSQNDTLYIAACLLMHLDRHVAMTLDFILHFDFSPYVSTESNPMSKASAKSTRGRKRQPKEEAFEAESSDDDLDVEMELEMLAEVEDEQEEEQEEAPVKRRGRPPKTGGKKRPAKEKKDPQSVAAFEMFRGEESKQLTADGLQLALGALGIEVSAAESNAHYERADENVDLATFLQIAKALPKTRDDAQEAFDLLDEDQKGYIGREDLQRLANELDEAFSEQDFDGMMRIAEDNGGVVTRDSFIEFYRGSF